MVNILSDLNSEQEKAVKIIDSPVCVIAGPGTGKTKTLTCKVAYLIKVLDIPPKDIIALTFTRKAAAEMNDRICDLTGKTYEDLFVGTFHALAHKILSQKEDVKIITEDERQDIVSRLLKDFKFTDLRKKFSLRDAISQISKFKSAEDKDQDLVDLVSSYNEAMLNLGVCDYDDLIINALEMVNEKKYPFILIDEFQDTNEMQYRLIKAMAGAQDIFAIGDPNQSIYSFRATSSLIFQKFKNEFPQSKEVNLQINYRSSVKVGESFSEFFPNQEKLKNFKTEEGRVCVIKTYNEYSEAEWVLEQINRKVGGIDLNFAGEYQGEENCQARFSEFAVIYRTHNIKRVLEKKFYESGIPYQAIGGDSLYELKEIKILINCLAYLLSPEEEILSGISGKEKNLISKTCSLVVHEGREKKLSEIIDNILELLKLTENAKSDRVEASLQEIKNSALRFDKYNDGLARFIAYVKYLKEREYYDEKADKVTLMSIHASKGLEFNFVFLIGFEEGIIPYIKKGKENNVEEEKRLLYVAMSRATNELYLITCKKRFGKPMNISRYMKHIRPYVEEIEDKRLDKISKKIAKNKHKQMGLF